MKILIMFVLLTSLIALIHAYYNFERLNLKYCTFVQKLQIMLLPVAIYGVYSTTTEELSQLWIASYFMLSVVFIVSASTILTLRVWFSIKHKRPKVHANSSELIRSMNETLIRKINKVSQ